MRNKYEDFWGCFHSLPSVIVAYHTQTNLAKFCWILVSLKLLWFFCKTYVYKQSSSSVRNIAVWLQVKESISNAVFQVRQILIIRIIGAIESSYPLPTFLPIFRIWGQISDYAKLRRWVHTFRYTAEGQNE